MLTAYVSVFSHDFKRFDRFTKLATSSKTHRAAYETLDAGAQIDRFALDFLGVLLADHVQLGGDMPLVGAPSICVKSCDTKWRQ